MSVNDSPPGSNSALRNQIAELTQTKKLLREANERLEMILVSMTERLFALDGEWRYTYFNKHAEEQLKILAKDPVRLIGKVLWDEFPNAPPEEVLRRAMSERVAIRNEHYYPPLGEWVENRIYPTPDGGLAIFQTYITERKRAEEALRQSHRRIENILESITDSFYALDREWRYTYINVRGLRYLQRAMGEGLTRDDVLGKNVWEMFPAFVGSMLYQKFHEAMREQRAVSFEALSPVTGRWVELSAYPSQEGLSVYYRDITERKRVEEQLAYHAHLLENVHDAVIATDERFVLTAWNKGAEQMYGWRADEVLGRNVWEVVPTELSHEQRAEARRQLAETGRRRAEVITYRKDGTQVHGEGCSIALRGEQGQITGYLGINRDITERKRSEMALHRSQQKLQVLTTRLMEAQEAENKYLARELHDDFSQRLAVLGMEIAALAQRTTGSSEELGGRLLAITAQIGTLSKEIHRICRRLHPAILDDLGLAAALKNECAAFTEQYGIPIDFDPDDIPRVLPGDISLCLYRIAQECLRNSGKHARAAKVRLALGASGDEIAMEIADDGEGFDLENVKGKGGLGLISMEERVRLVNGTFSIRSQPGKGTYVNVRLPLSRKE